MCGQEGVVAPPEETFSFCADSDINAPSLTFDTFEDIEKSSQVPDQGPSIRRHSSEFGGKLLSVEELEKRFRATTVQKPLSVSELEAQLHGSMGFYPSNGPRFPSPQGRVLGASLLPQAQSSTPWGSSIAPTIQTQMAPNLGASHSPGFMFTNDASGHGFEGNSEFRSLGNMGPEFSPHAHQKYKFMSASEIEKILAFQVQNTQVQNPYSEDYYYHAFMKKYRRGAVRFSPLSMKELDHQEQSMKAEVKFADLQGLGKIPFSNLRTPRPLIDFLDNESLASAEEEAGLQSIQWEYIRSAQRTQAMHARKLIEDSMCLLLEVDDVDRLAMSECGKVDLRKLAARRRDLIGSIVAALRIPPAPEGHAGRYNSDGVFLRLMSIAKGRSLLAKLLNVLVPPRPFQALPTDTKPLTHICWTTLRNIRALFGPTTWITRAGVDVDVPSLTAETSKIAIGLKEVILVLKSTSDVCKAFEALARGDLMSSDGSLVTPEELLLPFLPPNHVPGGKTGIWLEDVLVALLQRALEVGLAQRIGFTHPTGAYTDFELMKKWEWVFGVLYEAVTAHLKILVQVHRVAKERNQPQALEYAKGLLGKDLLSATLMLCNQHQFARIKQIVNALLEW